MILNKRSLVYINCNLCGENNTKFILSKKGILTNIEFSLVKCNNCGLLYLNPRLSGSDLISLYNEEYYNGKGFDNTINYVKEFNNEFVKTDTEFIIKSIKKLLPNSKKVLDIGCGTGNLMKEFSKEGFEVEGIELSPFAAEFAIQRGYKVHKIDFSKDYYQSNDYDIITAIEVLEHVDNPKKFLTNVYNSLKTGGVFYFTTANFKWYYIERKLLGKARLDNFVAPEGHIYFFSDTTLKKYFQEIGFSKVIYYRPSDLIQKNKEFKSF